jgi:hypothetical protein
MVYWSESQNHGNLTHTDVCGPIREAFQQVVYVGGS